MIAILVMLNEFSFVVSGAGAGVLGDHAAVTTAPKALRGAGSTQPAGVQVSFESVYCCTESSTLELLAPPKAYTLLPTATATRSKRALGSEAMLNHRLEGGE